MKYNLVHAGTCLSDYWGGHHLPHVAIPVDGTITVKGVLDQVRSEINQGAFAGSLDWETLESEEFYEACCAALQELMQMNCDILDKPAFPNLEPWEDGDCGESVMAFFVFAPVEDEDEDEDEE